MKRLLLAVTVFSVLLLVGCNTKTDTAAAPDLTTPYHAILLQSGQAYFGKVSGLGTSWITLTDVFYVQSSVNQETKAVSNVLVKRGREWHGPDRMIVNAQHVVFVEPVNEGSRVAQLIKEAK